MTEQEMFEANVEKIIDVVLNNKYDRKIFSSDYKYYTLENNMLVGNNYNSQTNRTDYNLKYDISGMNLEFINVIQNKSDELYLSIKNEKYCAVKSFTDENFFVYNVDDYENCNIDVFDISEEVDLFIYSMFVGKNIEYTEGTVAIEPIFLSAVSNLLDISNCSYRWYRNGLEIENSNNSSYFIELENEDAYYSVELTSPDGKIIKSDSFHVVITG